MMSIYQLFKEKSSTESDALSTVKSLLQNAWPHLSVERLKPAEIVVPSGRVHMISTCSDEGLVWNTLSRTQVTEEVFFMKPEELKIISVFEVGQKNT
jgi:hypothetical protein